MPISTQTQQPNTKHPELLHSALALGIGAALTLDRIQGIRGSHNYRTDVQFHSNVAETAVGTLAVLPGCQMNGKVLFERLRPYSKNHNLIVTDYPEKTFDVQQICEGLAKQLIARRAERPSLLCQSMGGIVVRHFLEYVENYGIAEKLGGFNAIVLDDPLHDASDIRPPYHALLKGANAVQHSWFADHLKPMFMAKNHGFSAKTHIVTVADQGNFILNTPHPNGTYGHLVENAYLVHGPSGDKVVRTVQAIDKFNERFNHRLWQVVDPTRPPQSHTAGESQYSHLLNLL